MRLSHYIKDNKTSEYPREFIFFDTETMPQVLVNGDIDQPFKLGVALYWQRRDNRVTDTLEYLHFTSIPEFWQFVVDRARPKQKLILVAHNIQFDFMVLGGFGYLRMKGFELTKLITNSKTNIFIYRRDNQTILCLDNMNYFILSIKALGKELGMPKLPMPQDGAPIEDWFTYCQRDVDIMYQAWYHWLSFLHDNDLGAFGKTITSQAFNAYRHRFMRYPILVSKNKKATELERTSYRGGRVECFKLGQLPSKDYYLLDVNSLYPYCMKVNPYPTRILYIKDEPTIEFVKKLLAKRAIIGDVLVSVDKPIFGVKHANRLIFPVGTFRVTLTTQELCKAITEGYLKHVYRIVVYHKEFIFSDYVDYFYNQRLSFKAAGKPVYAYLCKRLLNHLYGKFGQRNEEWVFIRTEPEPVDYVEVEIDAQTGKRSVVRCIAGQVSETRGLVEGYNSFAAISSEVTANARLVLWTFIEKAGHENVFYTDTDSLLVNKIGYDRLATEIDQQALGKLKLVQKSNDVTLHNVKDYVIAGRAKIKGISKLAEKVTENEYITYQQQGIRASLHNKNVNAMVWRKVPKRLHRIYEKAIIKYDSFVYPLILMYSIDSNWLDYEGMLEVYGEYATYKGRYLDAFMEYYALPLGELGESLEDYSPADRRQIVIDETYKRRAGDMIYQR